MLESEHIRTGLSFHRHVQTASPLGRVDSLFRCSAVRAPSPGGTPQQHGASEHMAALSGLQHDGCDITSDTVNAA
ncbi:hypothetical protein EYF80_001344 [Liparis tanakae]|uniref:Uncharacterized protein n=1 Tax=Liparis tanakae TaxID=230148 RepID=A0A4Z2JEW1_9TELE|nr:hypothetical protein EYF80_001344 [Liparis tanakae]